MKNDRDVVADEIEHAFVRVELHREAADVADGVRRAPRADDRREAGEDRRDPSRLQEVGAVMSAAVPYASNTPCAAVPRAWTTRSGIRSWSKCMTLAQVEVLHQRGPAATGLQRVVGLRQTLTLRRRQEVAVLRGHLAHPGRQYWLSRRVCSEPSARLL